MIDPLFDDITTEDIEAVKRTCLPEVAELMGRLAAREHRPLMTQKERFILTRLYGVSQWSEIPSGIRLLLNKSFEEGWERDRGL